MKHIFLDYETASLANLKVVGLDNYMKDPSTRILMLAWAIDQGEIRLWFPHEGPMPQELLDAWRDHDVVKVAWSAEFEYNATLRVLPRQCGVTIDAPFSEYRDPIVLAHNISLPGKLEKVGEILHMTHQKDARGKELIKMFSLPVSRGGEMTLFGIAPPLFRDHNSHPEQWKVFADYCVQDVRTERDLWYRLSRVPFPEDEWPGWLLNAHINAFGMPVNRARGEKMLRMAERYVTGEKTTLRTMTGLKNPNSDSQMKKWVTDRGYTWNSVKANYVQAELDNPDSKITPECREALVLRAKIRKSSYKKLVRLLKTLSEDDDRLRFQFHYMGAARTGRWAGGDVQVQNLSRGTARVKKNLAHALELIDAEDYDAIVNEFTNTADPKQSVTVVEVVDTCLRSLFEAKPGNKLEVADLNAIENRGVGWVAGCKAILDVFRTCNDCGFLVEDLQGQFLCPKCGCKSARCPYLSFGTLLFKKTYAEMWHEYHDLGKKDDRQNSKPPVLGAGYGLGGGELIKNENGDMVRGGLWGYAKSVCGVDMPKELAHEGVKIYREKYPEVVQLWTDLEEAFKQVLVYGGTVEVGKVTWNKSEREWVPHTHSLGCVLKFSRRKMAEGGWMMVITLPSGRSLHYLNATIDEKTRIGKKDGRPYKSQVIHYDGVEHSASQDDSGQTKKKKMKWGRVKTYGGKLTENVVQAISRDLLLYGMKLANDMGFPIWGLFHDEIATEVADTWDGLRVDDLVTCMSEVPAWAPGLLLGAEGYSSAYYKKE